MNPTPSKRGKYVRTPESNAKNSAAKMGNQNAVGHRVTRAQLANLKRGTKKGGGA